MTDRVFADTNVWVYLVDHDEASKRDIARSVLEPQTGIRLVTSAQVMSEFYITATRKLARPVDVEVATRMVDRMARLDVVALDATLVRDAIDGARTWGISYWDALIVAAAAAAGCRRLLTEDLTDGATYGSVRAEDPFRQHRRISEGDGRYPSFGGVWTDEELLVELGRYEEVARQAGMRPNAIHSYWDYARRFLAWRTGDYRPRGASQSDRPVPTGVVDVATLTAQVATYVAALRDAGLRAVTIDTYERHAAFFVRWLAGEFTPGARLAP